MIETLSAKKKLKKKMENIIYYLFLYYSFILKSIFLISILKYIKISINSKTFIH